MEAASNDLNSSQNIGNINNNATVLGEAEKGQSRAHGVADVLVCAQRGHRHDANATSARNFAGGDGISAIDFLGSRSKHHQPMPSHHSVLSIPEGRCTAVSSKHASSYNQEGSSPDPHSPATTTGTTSTPTSLGGSSSPPLVEAGVKAAGPPPDFHSNSLRSGQPDNVLPGEWHWQASIGEGRTGPRYGPIASNPADSPEFTPYKLSPTEAPGYRSSNFPCAIKLLVSNNVAGSIIGRAGQTIRELQSQSATRIKLSQTGDYYPGSQDRVCLVQGQLENVKGALRLLIERLCILQQHQHMQHMACQSIRSEGAPPFDFVVRILVPASSCGMIIGKSGANIRQMEVTSGITSVRLSPKDVIDPNYPSATITSVTSERVVTLTGASHECCLKCLFIILEGMVSHPVFCRYANMTTSYSRLTPDPFAGSPSTLRTGPPVEVMHCPDGSQWDRYSQSQLSSLEKRGLSSPELSGTSMGHRTPMALEQRLESVGLHTNRDNLPYSPMSGGQAPSPYSPLRPQTMPRMPLNPGPPVYIQMDNQEPPRPIGTSASHSDLPALQLESGNLSSSPPQLAPPLHSAAHQDYPLCQSQSIDGGPAATVQILVPDNMIGSILGRGGRTLNELQVQSGTTIRISQRGEYLPGTQNRIVIIRGPHEHSVNLAQYLMSQRMILPRTATCHEQLGQPQSMPSLYSDGNGPLRQYTSMRSSYADEGPPPDHLFHHRQPPSPQSSPSLRPAPPIINPLPISSTKIPTRINTVQEHASPKQHQNRPFV